LESKIELWACARADAIFTYTEGGRARLLAAGLPASKITSLNNSTNWGQTRMELNNLSFAQLQDFLFRHKLQPKKTLAYIGGVDTLKGADFLVSLLDQIFSIDTEIKLLLGGDGESLHLFQRAIERGQVIHLGRVGPKEKALIAKSASALLQVGPVGLVAVDALAMGLPIVTRAGQQHPPEIEYLKEGESLHFLDEHSPAAWLVEFLKTGENARTLPDPPELSDKVSHFTKVVLGA
jgi:glycosyltransferase involved in cell wall biosynthesis